MKKHRFLNMYFTTAVSISLVLFLIGLEAVMLLSSREMVKDIRENVSMTLVLNDETDSTSIARVTNLLNVAPFTREYKYISKDDALQEHINTLGEDPAKFLGYNPLHASIEVYLHADYAASDSLPIIESKLSCFPFIQEILYDTALVDLLDENVERASWLLIGIAFVLLFVAIALIINTVRIHVYSKRFLIRTMQLVGATPFVVKRPIVSRNVRSGLVAALIALLLLAGSVYLCQQRLGILLIDLTWQNIAIVCAIVIFAGLLLTALASTFAVNRYIKMKTDDLYIL